MILTIDNQTGSKKPIHFGILGQTPDGQWGYLHANGEFTEASSSGDTVHFFELSSTPNVTLPPGIISGRCFISVGQAMNIPIGSGGFTGPVFVGGGHLEFIYDKFEFTHNTNGSINCNTTCVDFFGIPITLTLQCTDGNPPTVGATARKEVWAAFQEAGSPWPSLILGDYRIVNPAKQPSFGLGYYDDFLTDVWAKQPLTIHLPQPPGGTTVTGQPSGTSYVFPGGITVDKPGTFGGGKFSDIFGCAGNLSPQGGNNNKKKKKTQGKIVRQIGAALNRGIFGNDPKTWCDGKNFYHTQPYNVYSQLMHKYTTNPPDSNHECYGFPFDDVCDLYSTDIGCSSPTKLTVTLHSLATA